MPSPVGHTLVGLIVFKFFAKQKFTGNLLTLISIIVISNLADFDFFPGLIVGEPNRFHHGISHSFGFVLILTCLTYLVAKLRNKLNARIIAVWFFILSSTHIIMDYFAVDTSLPYGEPLLWPVLNSYLISPFSLFQDIRRSNELVQFFPSLFSWHNFLTIAREISIVFFIGIIIVTVQKIFAQKSSANIL